MTRSSVIINFSAPPGLAREISRLAKKEDKTQSELLRDAVRSYAFDLRMRRLQEKGKVIARELGLETYDDIEKFFG